MKCRNRIVFLVMILMASGVSHVFAGGKSEPIITLDGVGDPGAAIQIRGLIGAWNTIASTDPARKAYYMSRLELYVQENPDVFVEIETIPGGQTAQAMTKLITAAAANSAPDFANIDSQWVGNFYEADVLESIDSLLSADERSEFFDYTKEVTMRNGQQYTLWAETGIMLYYYNTDLISRAARTWNDVVSDKSDVPDGVATFLMPGKGAAAAHTFLPFFWGQGGILFDPDDNFRPVFGQGENRTKLVNALRFLQELRDTDTMPAEMVTYEHADLGAQAKAGLVASMVTGSWIYGGLDADKWNYAGIPMLSADTDSNAPGGWTFGFFSKDETNLEKALEFVRTVYTSREAMTERLPLHGYIPTRRDVFASPAFSSPFYTAISQQLEYGRARPATSLYPLVETGLGEIMGKVMSGDSNIGELVDQLYDEVVQAYQSL